MLLFDPTEPFALLDSAAVSFIDRLLGKTVKGEDRYSSFFKDEDSKPKPFLIDEVGATISEDAAASPSPGRKLIAVVPLWGTLSPDGRYYGTSTKEFAKQVTAYANNEQIGAIVLKIDSPGGTVTGTVEAADAIRALRGTKPIVASVDSMMASAASWIGTTAKEVAITPSGEAGSIGVINIYADYSKAYESFGVKIDVMRTPEKKARFSGVEPLTEEMRATIVGRLDNAYDQFKRAMAENRGVAISSVEGKFGGGEMLNAKESLSAGLVDRIATFDEVLNSTFSKVERQSKKAPTKAEAAKLSLLLVD